MRKYIFTFLLLGVLILAVFYSFPLRLFQNIKVSAASSDLSSGWAWSSNIGWISFNCTNEGVCSTFNYGVTVEQPSAGKKKLSGFAWSSNIGLVTFNEADLGGCPGPPCKAEVDFLDGAVSGWARAWSCISPGCTGGWDGWIHLSGPTYSSPDLSGNGGVTLNKTSCQLLGNAWGGGDNANFPGWIKFRGTAGDGSPYGVDLVPSACNQAPIASLSCQNSVDGIPSTECTTYLTGGAAIPLAIVNSSSDPDGDTLTCSWTASGPGSFSSSKSDCSNWIISYPSSAVGNGGSVFLAVDDGKGGTDTESVSGISVRDLSPDFLCSLTSASGPFVSCTSIASQVSVGQTIWFQDSSTSVNTSISSRSWTFSGGSPPSAGDVMKASTKFTSQGSKSVSLTATDVHGVSITKSYPFTVKPPLPQFKEVKP